MSDDIGKPKKSGYYLNYELPEDQTAAEIMRWWLDTAYEDFQMATKKALEYGGSVHGSADLVVMGFGLSTLLGERGVAQFDAMDDAVSQEIAVFLYALGKVSRLIADYRASRPGKADSWTDLCCYAYMARRIQSVGQWP